MLERNKEYLRQDVDVELKSRVDPCVFMYPNYPLQISVNLPDSGGGAFLQNKSLTAETATDADVIALLAKVRIKPCSRCSKPAFDTTTVNTNRNGLCETCFLADMDIEWAKIQEKENRRLLAQQKKMKAKGFKFQVAAWVHAGGDDKQIDIFFSVRPTNAEIKKLLKKRGSRVLNDYQVIEL